MQLWLVAFDSRWRRVVSHTPSWIRTRVGPSAGLLSMGKSLYFREIGYQFFGFLGRGSVTVLSGYLAQYVAAECYRDSVDDCLGLGYLLFVGYRRYFSGGEGSQGVMLTTHLHLVPRLRMSGAIPLLPPLWLHVVLFTVCDCVSG